MLTSSSGCVPAPPPHMLRNQEECEPTAFNGAENEDIGEGGGEPYRGKVPDLVDGNRAILSRVPGDCRTGRCTIGVAEENKVVSTVVAQVGFLATKVRFKMRCYGENCSTRYFLTLGAGEGAGGLMTQAECDMPKDLLGDERWETGQTASRRSDMCCSTRWATTSRSR
eukprot:767281-Hanusia_phi.AAC.1